MLYQTMVVTKLGLALIVVSSGCMATITYEPRSFPTAPRSQPEACYQHRRLELTGADATWSFSSGGSYNAFSGVMTQTTTTMNERGLAVYQDGQLLELDEALKRTGDVELVRGHDQRVASTRGSSLGYKLARNASIALTAGGLVLVGVATAQIVTDKDLAHKGLGDFPLLWIGTGLTLAAIVPAIAASIQYRRAVDHSIDTKIIRSHLVDRTFEAVRTYNRRVMAECGFQGGDELPVAPSLRGLLR